MKITTKIILGLVVLSLLAGFVYYMHFYKHTSLDNYARLNGAKDVVGPAIVDAMEDGKITNYEYEFIWSLYVDSGDNKDKAELIEYVKSKISPYDLGIRNIKLGRK